VSDHVYSVSEIVGSSPGTIDDAIKNALERARKTLRHLDWFEVTEIRGHLKEDGAIDYFQVALKVGFRLES
jgi:dodecin